MISLQRSLYFDELIYSFFLSAKFQFALSLYTGEYLCQNNLSFTGLILVKTLPDGIKYYNKIYVTQEYR